MPFYETKDEAEKDLKELQKNDPSRVYSIYKLDKTHPSGKKYQVVGLSPKVLRTLEKM